MIPSLSILFNNNAAAIATTTTTVLYSAWFCPFAQRAWCALNELGVSYHLIESLQVHPETHAYIKDEGLLQANPKGLVPTLVVKPQDDDNQDSITICDSMEILKELYCARAQQPQPQQQSSSVTSIDTSSTSGDPLLKLQYLYQEAMDWNQEICSTAFYSVLMKQDAPEREEAWKELAKGLVAFSEQLQYTSSGSSNENVNHHNRAISFYTSDFASGKEPSMVDFCVFPFMHRLYIIEHYKGLTLSTSDEQCAAHGKLEAWRRQMEALPSVQATLADPTKLIPIYERYADGTAKSKVGDSIRQGSNVHDV